MKTPVRVMVVEDEPLTLDQLVTAIHAHPVMTVLHSAATLTEARESLVAELPDVLLTDLGLPDGDGVDLIREVCGAHPNVLVLVLSALGDEQHVISAIMAGAKGYLLKGSPNPSVCDAITQLTEGASPITASIARYLLVKLQGDVAPHRDVASLLTEREIEVLELVAQGYRSSEIASRLCISYHTVVHHIRSVYDKLAVRSRAQAIYKASQIGLLANRDDH